MIQQAAEWIAPIATMIAAMMTAANLGARITGWGFAIFSIGAVAWTAIGFTTGQHGLLVSNAFLLIVNIVGVWRWLGRRARYDEGANVAAARSHDATAPALFALGRIEGRQVCDASGKTIATVVDAMARCDNGGIDYLVVSVGGVGGVGERLHALGWNEIDLREDGIESHVDARALARRPVLEPARWPGDASSAGVER